MNGGRQGETLIIGAGAQTPLGRSALAAAAAVRAGLSAIREHPYLVDRYGEPFVCTYADWLQEELPWVERVTALGTVALDEALLTLETLPSAGVEKVALLLSVPESRPGFSGEDLPRVAEIFQHQVRERIRRCDVVQLYPEGHAAGFLALREANRLLTQEAVELCIVGGVDSYLQVETLEWLDETERLHSADNSWGFIPGEGAAFCVMTSHKMSTMWRRTGMAVLGIGAAREQHPDGCQRVCVGDGLTCAFREALACVDGPAFKVDEVFCDLNGNSYRADEFAFTMARMAELFRQPVEAVTPADGWGDIGAASVPLFVVLAAAGWQRCYAKGPLALLWASSGTGTARGAAVLGAPDIEQRSSPWL